MTPNPILKVLFTFRKFGVKSLLIGGQACIVYGAAEFSRDSDFFVLCNPENLDRIRKAISALRAKNIYVPPLIKKFLDKGHACHFRCYAEPVRGLRIDVMAKLRGCDPFEKLWERKRTVKLPDNGTIHVIGIEDLVKSKKTQRDKDWFMLQQLVENDITVTKKPSVKKISWWMLENRSPERLIQLAGKYRKIAIKLSNQRSLLKTALGNNAKKLKIELQKEEQIERLKDKQYWQPLMEELELLRHKKVQ